MVQTGQIDIKAFEDSFRKLFRPLCMYAMHYVRDADVAEDIVEECFVRLLQRGFPEGGRITSYIHASVRNQAIDYLRKNKSVRILPEDEEGLISDEEAFGASCEESRIWEALERLPLRRRQIFIMSRRDGMSHEGTGHLCQDREEPDFTGSCGFRPEEIYKNPDFFLLVRGTFCRIFRLTGESTSNTKWKTED